MFEAKKQEEVGGSTNSDEKKQVPLYINPIYGFSLDKVVYRLLKTEPFFAHFLMDCRVVYDDPKVKTAAASMSRGDIFFYFNRNFMATYPIGFQKEIVKHEIFHILLDHCGKRGGRYGNLNRHIKNVAMDCAINQYLNIEAEVSKMVKNPNIEGELLTGITLNKLIEQTKLALEPLQNWEYYYQNLMSHLEKNGQVEYAGLDDHDIMDEGSDGDDGSAGSSINRGRVGALAKKAANAAAGNMSQAIASIIGSLSESKLSWRQILRNFVANNRDSKRIATRQKSNRRFELDQPGYRRDKKLRIGVCVDESGSVSDEAFSSFMAEIYQIVKSTSFTAIAYADCEVQHVEKIKNGKVKKEKLMTRYGSGGTAYQPAISKCMELNVDCIIYMGDMDSADTPKNPGVPFLWVRVGKQNPPGNFGKVIDLD